MFPKLFLPILWSQFQECPSRNILSSLNFLTKGSGEPEGKPVDNFDRRNKAEA